MPDRHGARVAKRLRGAAVLEVPGAALDAMAQDPSVSHLSGDVPVRRLMAVTTEAIGADQVWRGALAGLEGRTGTGIGVAVIDSGIASHQALRNRVVASVDFTGRNGSGRDQYGHGTHVAGIIAGSPDSGYAGVAPGAHLVNLQVLNADGSGDTSDVIAAIDWAIEHRAQLSASASSTYRSGTQCSKAIVRIRCARPCSGRSTRGWWWWRRQAISARRRTARPSSAGSCRRATRRRR